MARKRRSSRTGPRARAILIRVDDDELRMLRDVATRRGTTVSLAVIDAIRLMAGRLDQEREERESPVVDELRSIRYELRRIGVNVNQIAHWANQEMTITGQEHDATVNAVMECRRLVAQATTAIDSAQHGKL